MTLSREQQETRRRYAFADALALRARRQTVLAQRLLHLLVYAAFVCFILFAHLPGGHHPEWLVMALVSLGLAGICYYRARTSNVDTRYQDYRAIAEGLRVSLFWKLVDVKDDVAAYYLRKQRTELDWIRDALRSWHVAGPRSPEHAQASNAGLAPLDSVKVAATHWVKSQKSYFEAAAEANHDRAERYELLANVAVGITVSLVVLLTIALFVPASEEYLHHHPSVTAYWIIAIDVILAAGALLHHYNERMAFSEISKQYARMEHIFEHVGRHLAAASDAKDIEAARAWLRALGTEALAENGDWVLLHRERPLLLPHP